jgi:hypothetical protein
MLSCSKIVIALKQHNVKTYLGMAVCFQPYLTLAIYGCDWSFSRSNHFTLMLELRYVLNRRSLGPRGGLDPVERRKTLCHTEQAAIN